MLTNARALWAPRKPGDKLTRDHDFRIHEGRTLAGQLRWARGTHKGNARSLRGVYPLRWQPFSQQEGLTGEFRYLAAPGARGLEPDAP